MWKRSAPTRSSIAGSPDEHLRLAVARHLGHVRRCVLQTTLCASAASAKCAARKSPGLVTSRAWSWPVRRPSRTTRLRRKPACVSRSYADSPSLSHQSRTRARSVVDRRRGEHVLVDVDDLAPAARRVEAEHELAVRVLAERVLELVAVVPLLDGRDDRLDRRPLEAADALERVDAPGAASPRAGARTAGPATARPGAARAARSGRAPARAARRRAPRRSCACA